MSNYNWNNKVFIFYLFLNYLDLLSKKTPAKDMQKVKNRDKIEISSTPKVVRKQTSARIYL